MKTLITILLMLSVAGLLLAQTDSTLTDTIEAEIAEPLTEAVDSLQTEESAVLIPDSTDIEELAMDSVAVDTSAETAVEEPAMIMVQKEPDPINIAGLMNQGPLFFWSNDGLEGIGFESLSYVTIDDPTMIAIKANDCLDIVCHLLASDSSGLDYVIVTPEDSSNFQIYNTITKVVIIEAPAAEITTAFDTYLRDLSGMEQLLAVEDTPFIGPEITDGLTPDTDMINLRAEVLRIKRLNFRSMDELFTNPANLAREFNTFTAWSLLSVFNINVRNSLVDTGWYQEWWTTGGVWGVDRKNEYLATIMDQDLALNVSPDFQSLFGFRIGKFGLNISAKSHLKMVVPGNILRLPMSDILLDDAIDISGLEIEAVPFVAKSALSYAHPLSTPYGDLKVGVSLNMFGAAGYMRMLSDDFTMLMTQDSIIVTATGETWYTNAGAEGHLDDPDLDNLEVGDMLSDPSFGLDLGLIMDLQSYVDQEVEVQLSLRNIGAKYQWSNITHESWTYEQLMPDPGSADFDSIEQYEHTETILLGTDEELSIDIPTVLNLAAIYQPHDRVLLGIGIEKAFTDEIRFGYSPDLEFTYQLNLFATPWLDFRYHRQTQFGEGVHTFGSGLHFGFLDTGFSMSFFNGLNTNMKGIGFGLNSSLHF